MGQVPYTLQDDQISDDWQCADNTWDQAFNSCSVPQALSDEEIDAILAKQVSQGCVLLVCRALDQD